MHSMKNTIVAVGLLGLSFLFYQLSSKKPSDESSTELIAPMVDSESLAPESFGDNSNVADGSPAAPARSASSANAFGSPVGLEAPRMNASVAPSKSGSLSGSRGGKSDGGLTPPSASSFSAPEMPRVDIQPAPLGGTTNGFKAPDFNNNSLAPQPRNAPLDNQTLPPIARDRGLMDALEKNKQTRLAPPNDGSNGFSPTAPRQPNNGAADTTRISENPRDNSFIQPAGVTDAGGIDLGIKVLDRGVVTANNQSADYSNVSFRDAWPIVEAMVEKDQLTDALRLLTRFYGDSKLTGPQHQRLNVWLDALASKVIFSAEHRLADLYVADGLETLEQLGTKLQVPAMLIYNVNSQVLPNPNVAAAGVQLKVVPGPFHAKIKLNERMMTLFLGDLYAGRFPVRIGISGQPRPGTFGVMMKSAQGQTWRDSNGTFYEPSSPLNGYGAFFIGIEGELCIHAANDDKQDGHYGCFGLSPKDAEDVFNILSESSKVTIE